MVETAEERKQCASRTAHRAGAKSDAPASTVQPGGIASVSGEMMGRLLWISCLAALAATGCTVGDGGNPFPSANSGSTTATASGPSSSGSGSEGSGGSATSNSSEGGSEDGSTTGSWNPGDTTTTTTTTASGSTGADAESSGGVVTGGSESSGGNADTCMGAPLDPQLAVPPLCEPTCTSIGFGNDCAGLAEYCRLKDSQTAVCESCDACGNLHAPCVTTADCDIIFTCFMGQCTAQCDLNTPQTCGNPAACTNVGHPTHGVCDPNI